jgi:hypothetical protein
MGIFRPLHGFTRMFQRLFGMLVPRLVFFLPVVYSGSSMRVRGEFVEFSSSLVRVTWHDSPILGGGVSLEASHFPYCSILNSQCWSTRVDFLPFLNSEV